MKEISKLTLFDVFKKKVLAKVKKIGWAYEIHISHTILVNDLTCSA